MGKAARRKNEKRQQVENGRMDEQQRFVLPLPGNSGSTKSDWRYGRLGAAEVSQDPLADFSVMLHGLAAKIERMSTAEPITVSVYDEEGNCIKGPVSWADATELALYVTTYHSEDVTREDRVIALLVYIHGLYNIDQMYAIEWDYDSKTRLYTTPAAEIGTAWV